MDPLLAGKQNRYEPNCKYDSSGSNKGIGRLGVPESIDLGSKFSNSHVGLLAFTIRVRDWKTYLVGSQTMAYITGTYFAPISRGNGRNYKLVGYWLNAAATNMQSSTNEIKIRLDDHCSHQGCQLNAVEWDNGAGGNPIRMGLWRALRRLICDKCPPRRMPMNFMHIDDFMSQALAPCHCGQAKGLDGLIVTSTKHLCSDPVKGSQIILRMAEAGKHFIGEDGICLSCCHPATKAMLQKKRLLIAS